jgi:hypothetical protein
VLELSGGVRSLPQVPQWNAVRRARDASREPHPLVRRLTINTRLPAFCFLLFALQIGEGSEPKRSRFRGLKFVPARGFRKTRAHGRRENETLLHLSPLCGERSSERSERG